MPQVPSSHIVPYGGRGHSFHTRLARNSAAEGKVVAFLNSVVSQQSTLTTIRHRATFTIGHGAGPTRCEGLCVAEPENFCLASWTALAQALLVNPLSPRC
jgi:hypothetical protein